MRASCVLMSLYLCGAQEPIDATNNDAAFDEFRLSQIVARMQPSFAALPKGPDGGLEQPAARYILHRYFVQQYGWYVHALQSSGTANAEEDRLVNDLRAGLESSLNGDGLSVEDVASVAASIEDLIHQQATDQLSQVYKLLGYPSTQLISNEELYEAITTYVMLYLKDSGAQKFSAEARIGSVKYELAKFKAVYENWSALEAWLEKVVEQHFAEVAMPDDELPLLDFASVASLVGRVTEKFGSFHDSGCNDLKANLMDMQTDVGSGRLRLSNLYKAALENDHPAALNDKAEYLRRTGSLDEASDPSDPRVIVANYISSPSHCLASHSLHSVCCRNECEPLIGALESEIASPTAEPGRIASLVLKMSSSTSNGRTGVTSNMIHRLESIAEAHGGRVPLQGRLFSQWMHQVFPLECPYPHLAGTVSRQTPEEWWMSQAEHEEIKASEREMSSYVAVAKANDRGGLQHGGMHWNDIEEPMWSVFSTGTEPVKLTLPAHDWQFGLLCLAISCSLAAVLGGLLGTCAVVYVNARCGETISPSSKLLRAIVSIAAIIVMVAMADSTGVLDRRVFAYALGAGGVVVCLPAALRVVSSPPPKAKKME